MKIVAKIAFLSLKVTCLGTALVWELLACQESRTTSTFIYCVKILKVRSIEKDVKILVYKGFFIHKRLRQK